MFASYDEMDDCFNAASSMFHSKKHKANAILLLGLGVNTTLEICAQELEKEIEEKKIAKQKTERERNI